MLVSLFTYLDKIMNELSSNIMQWQRILITIGVMLAALMQVLDTTITNVALPYIQGSLSTNPTEISWALTSYMVASVLVMPLTGYLSDKLGMKNYLLLSIASFIIASMLCGIVQNFTEMVICRLLQGAFGAALVPLSQGIITAIFPKTQRAKALAIFGFGIMIGPILGPTLGGYLTEIASWRWVFFINIPLGIIAFLLCWFAMSNTLKKERAMDWLGLTFISLFIGSLQYFLDRGNAQDWLSAWDIRIAVLLCIGSILAFIIHYLFKPERIVFDLHIFKNHNFLIASLLISLLDIGMFGIIVMQPLMLENLFHYPILTTGLIMSPRGVGGILGMLFMGKFGQRINPQYSIAIAIICSIISTNSFTHLSLSADPMSIMWPMFTQGFCVSTIFVSVSMIAYSTLEKNLVLESAGLFSLIRTLSGSIGISLVMSVYTQKSQLLWNELGGFINPYNLQLTQYFNPMHMNISNHLALQILGQTLHNQSQILAFINIFRFITWSLILMLPLVLLIKKKK